MKNRNTYYDIIRIIAMFLVIGVHALGSIEQFCPNDIFSKTLTQILGSLNSLGVPLFFMLSGIFLLKRPVENIFYWYRHRIVRILLPFMLFGTIYVFYFTGIEQNNIVGVPLAYIKGVLCNKIHPTHWFVYAIIGLYFATPFLAKMFSNMTDFEVSVLYIGCLIFTLITDLLKFAGWDFGLNEYVFNTEHTLFFISGYCSVRLSESNILFKCIANHKWPIMIAALFGNYFIKSTSIFVYIFLMAAAVPSFIKCNDKAEKIISFISRHSYSIYLIHAAVISFLLRVYTNWTELYMIKAVLFYFAVWAISQIIVFLPDKLLIFRIESKRQITRLN